MTADDTIGPTIADLPIQATGMPRHNTRGCRTVKQTACLLWFIMALASLPPAVLAQENAATQVIIGTVSGQLDAPDAFSPFQEYLAQALPGYTFEISGFASIEGLMLAVENESLDFAFISPAAYVELTIDGNLRLLSTITQPVGHTHSPWLAGAVFTLDSRNDIETMVDVRGKRVVALSEIALGGWMSALREWRDLGININAEFASLDFVFSYSEVVDRVCSGQADIGVIAANTLPKYQEQCNAPLRVLPQPGISQNISYDIPHSTRLYPEVALVMVGNQDEEFIRSFTSALLAIEQDSTVAQSVNVSGFTAPLPYDEVRAMMEELRLGPWRRLGRMPLQQLLLNNIFLVTLALILLLALILGGFINAQRLSRRFQESERYRKLLFESSHIPMVVVDPKTDTFLDMNPAAVKLYGYRHKNDLVNRHVTFVSDPEKEYTSEVEEEMARTQQEALQNGHATFDWPHIRPNGESWIANIHLMSFDSPSGKLIQATVEDITQRRQNEKERQDLEQQLAFSQRMESIGRLAGGIAHDFNNLLTIINGYCEVLLLEMGSSKSEKILQQIRKAGIRASELTKQLLTFSRRQAIRQVPVNVNRIIRESSEIIRSVLGDNIRLKLDLLPGSCTVLSDPGQLQQVLINLVVNAKDTMPDGGVLEITTASTFVTPRNAQGLEIAAGEYIEIRVRDNGLGMSPGILQHIFEPFFTTKDNSGTGLGLSTVYGIVQQSLGTISVTSTEGEGSEFQVLLPKSKEAETRQEAEATPASPGLVDSGTILVVEDQVEVLDYVTSVLRESGYQVHTATSGSAAQAAMADLSEPVHLLITDVVMEGMSGGELAEIFSERYQGIPVLFISGYPGDELARYGVRQGMHEFLAKPFTPQQLLERVNQILKNLRVTG